LNKLLKFVAAVLLVTPLALAQQTRVYNESGNWTQEMTGTLANARNLRVQIESGVVKVNGGSQQGISYSIHSQAPAASEDKARRVFDSYKISAVVRGDTAVITAEWENGRPHKFNGEFVVNVPRDMESVKVETDGGSVSVNDIAGKADAQSGGGSIRIGGVGGVVMAETGGGNVDVDNVGGDLTAETGGGTIHITGAQGKVNASSGGGSIVVTSSQQETTLETGGGSIHLDNCGGKVKVSTGGGSIDLGNIGGSAEIETGGGSIRLVSAKGPVHAETGGGSIDLNSVTSVHAETGAGNIVTKIVPGGEHNDSLLETEAGDITVYVAPSVNIAIRASIEVASGHTIHSDFSEINVHSEGDWGPKTVTAEGNLNGGGPTLKIRTTTGNIYIRRAQ
jgi:DUF4097 and DUF4098 domain-containing protein YvlB